MTELVSIKAAFVVREIGHLTIIAIWNLDKLPKHKYYLIKLYHQLFLSFWREKEI